MKKSTAVAIALDHIEAQCRHDWEKTREPLSQDVHAWVTNTQPGFARTVEFDGIDEYMVRKVKAAQLIEPGSLQVISTFGDETNALILVTFKIGLGAGGEMVTMVRSCLYSLDENQKVKEERDEFLILPQTAHRYLFNKKEFSKRTLGGINYGFSHDNFRRRFTR